MPTTRTVSSNPPIPHAEEAPLRREGLGPARGTGLLVSVRNSAEAALALTGGADVIDVKEPRHGPLGAADAETLAQVVAAVGSRTPVTAALGELAESTPLERLPAGLSVAKVGLAGTASQDWGVRLYKVRDRLPHQIGLAITVYSDYQSAKSPAPSEAFDAARRLGVRWLVIDTWRKGGHCSIDLLGATEIAALIEAGRDQGASVVLAGGLSLERIGEAARLAPALVGVRGAACIAGREGSIDAGLVRTINDRLAAERRAGHDS